jgi:hypothetical protein
MLLTAKANSMKFAQLSLTLDSENSPKNTKSYQKLAIFYPFYPEKPLFLMKYHQKIHDFVITLQAKYATSAVLPICISLSNKERPFYFSISADTV